MVSIRELQSISCQNLVGMIFSASGPICGAVGIILRSRSHTNHRTKNLSSSSQLGKKIPRLTRSHRRRRIGVQPISSSVAADPAFRKASARNDTSADGKLAALVPLLCEARLNDKEAAVWVEWGFQRSPLRTSRGDKTDTSLDFWPIA